MSLRRGLPGAAGPLTLDNYVALFRSPFFLETLANTAVFALLSLLVTFVFLVPLTFLFSRTDLPFRTGFVVMLSIVVLIPTFLRAIGWIMLLSPEIGLVNRGLMAGFGLEYGPPALDSDRVMAVSHRLAVLPAGDFM